MCKKDCKHLEELDNHMDTKHSKYIKCGICEITFQEIREMNVHIDEEHDGSGKLNDPGMLNGHETDFKKVKGEKMGEILYVEHQGGYCYSSLFPYSLTIYMCLYYLHVC